jgi:segregation and condensation protein A
MGAPVTPVGNTGSADPDNPQPPATASEPIGAAALPDPAASIEVSPGVPSLSSGAGLSSGTREPAADSQRAPNSEPVAVSDQMAESVVHVHNVGVTATEEREQVPARGTVTPSDPKTRAKSIKDTEPPKTVGKGMVSPPPLRPDQFAVRLDNFEGPFDLLLTLISKHQLDVTEVALSKVTDEFIAHIRALGASWDLGQATEFLVIAATLLDLKAARLLPTAEVEDEEDLALLEARDLLFARLLQYRAYKQVAAHFAMLERAQARRFPRAVPLEPRYADLMPEILIAVSLERFARIAAAALAPKPPPVVATDHVHSPRVSIREHAELIRERLARAGRLTFRSLTQDCQHPIEVVARFLALLELYREGTLAFDQVAPLGELHVRWTGSADSAGPDATVDFDEEYG